MYYDHDMKQGLHTWLPMAAIGSVAGAAAGGLWSIDDRLLPPGVLPFVDCNRSLASATYHARTQPLLNASTINSSDKLG